MRCILTGFSVVAITAMCLTLLATTSAISAEPQTGEMSVDRVRSKLFRHQYTDPTKTPKVD